MAEVNPFDPIHYRITREKRTFTLSAGKTETLFFDDNEDGWVQEVLVYCNRADITLEITLGTDVESMKISDAYNFRLLYPNTSFWLSRYDTSNKLYCMAYQPFNLQPYKGSIAVKLINEGTSDATISRVIFKRIRLKRYSS